ncbi:MAG TPA: type I secretion protein TolC, partial [Caulobacteraceae bacterium]|nr:type I secretion protein TolC [Caulobacteraceae bacterium]
MLNTRRAALFAAVFSVGLLAAAGARGETLADAIALAYQTNPTLQEQRASQRALDENYVQARTGLRPNVDASLQATEREVRSPAGERPVDLNSDGVPDVVVPTQETTV